MTPERFLELLSRSGLVPEPQIHAATETLYQQRGGLPGEAKTLADWFVEQKLLTPWQAEQLLNGRYKRFILKNYKLLDHLGSGGMSNVYLAEHLLMRRRVAIKVLPQKRVSDSSYLQRFYREAQAAARLDHPNIVRAYDVEHEDDIHFLVMEYVEGCDLATLVRREGPLDYQRAADYIRQAAIGLSVAHRAGLVHRDVKPANLLVDRNNVVKLLDLGLARFSAADEGKASLTVVCDENVLGTADYLAPEQALDSHAADARADIYSLGCSLYFLLTGQPPFAEGTIAQRLLAHQKQTPPSIYRFRPDAPPALVEFCFRMMAKRPEDRPQTAEEAAEFLDRWLKGDFVVGPAGIPTCEHPQIAGGSAIRAAEASLSPGTVDAAGSVDQTVSPLKSSGSPGDEASFGMPGQVLESPSLPDQQTQEKAGTTTPSGAEGSGKTVGRKVLRRAKPLVEEPAPESSAVLQPRSRQGAPVRPSTPVKVPGSPDPTMSETPEISVPDSRASGEPIGLRDAAAGAPPAGTRSSARVERSASQFQPIGERSLGEKADSLSARHRTVSPARGTTGLPAQTPAQFSGQNIVDESESLFAEKPPLSETVPEVKIDPSRPISRRTQRSEFPPWIWGIIAGGLLLALILGILLWMRR